MSAVNNNISDYSSARSCEEYAALKPKRQRTLRRDLSDEAPREFRHISRLNTEVNKINCETQQSSQVLENRRDIISDIQQYFSGLNSPHLNTFVQPPKVRLTRELTKDDIAYPINFKHIAHIDYHEISKDIENMSDFGRRGSRSTDVEFPLGNAKENLSKEDISEPSAFRHVAHLGFEDNKIRINTEETTIKFSLDKAPALDGRSQDRDTRKNLTSIIQSSSGTHKESERENGQRKLLTKEDIGNPENFQHVVRVDMQSVYNPEKFLEKISPNKIDAQIKETQTFAPEITDKTTQPVPITKPIPKPRTIRKMDIESPHCFRHNAHISCNKDKPTPINDNDVVLKNFFKKAGVTEEQLLDNEIRKFIFDFVRQYSISGNSRNDQQKYVPHTYRNLAVNLQNEVDQSSNEEYSELLLAMYRRNFPMGYY